MTNFEHIKEISSNDTVFKNFLVNFVSDFCGRMCPLDSDPDKLCSGKCEQGVFMWLIGNYIPDSYIWTIRNKYS